MTLAAFLLVLSSAFLHAVWNAILKKQERPDQATLAVAGLASIGALLAVPFATGPPFPESAGPLWGLGAGLFEGAYFVTLGLAFRRSTLTLVYSVSRGGAVALVWPLSAAFLHESVTPTAVLGTVLVVLGLLVFGLGERLERRFTGIGWALVCSVCIASYHLCYKVALSHQAQPAALSALALVIALPVNALWLGTAGIAGARAAVARSPIAILLAGTTCAASFLVFLTALGGSGAGAVLTVRNSSVLFAALLAPLIGEKPSRRHVTAAVLVAVGATLVGWPRS